MELTPPWEAKSYSATQEIPSILCNPFRCRIHKSPPLFSILSHNSPLNVPYPVAVRSILCSPIYVQVFQNKKQKL
jgi:hypothetical protein